MEWETKGLKNTYSVHKKGKTNNLLFADTYVCDKTIMKSIN